MTLRLRRGLLSAGVVFTSLGSAYAQDANTATTLKPIVLESESDDVLVQDGYVGISDRIGTKTQTAIVRIPQAISVVTQDQMEDQKPRTLLESLTYTAGVNPNTFGYDSRYDAYYLRGFPAYYNGMFRDSLRIFNGPSAWLRTEPYGIEGVNVLKGPASSLYGVSGPGGIVNVMTKRPKDEPFHEVEALIGQDGRYQGAVDLSGPVDEDGALLYRLTTLGRKSDTHLDGYPDDKFYIAPAFTWKPDEDTKLTILGEYSHAVTGGTAAFYNPTYGTVSKLYGGLPGWNDFTQDQGRIGYEFEHRLNDVVTLRQNFRYNAVDSKLEYSGLYPAGGLPTRYWGYYTEDMQNLVVDNQVQFEFDTGNISHTAVAGFDYSWSEYNAYSAVSYTSLADLKAGGTPFSNGQRSNLYGLYLSDQMKWDDLTVFLSSRYDWANTRTQDAAFAWTEKDDSAFSGRIGVSYKTEIGLIPFANYSTSFAPNLGVVYDDPSTSVFRAAEPTRARQIEAGVKYEVPDTNAVLSAAVFDIDQKDGVVFDTSSGINKQVQLDLNSRGIELEANASFDNGFSLIASYTYQRMKIEKGAVGTDGNELSATPNHIASLWGHYLFMDGPLEGLGIGAGVRYAGRSFGDDANSFRNESRAFVDAAISYDFGARNPDLKGLELQINAKNVFDNVKPNCSAGTCYWDEGRTVYGSLRYRF